MNEYGIPNFSIVIPVFNDEKTLKNALDSVLLQGYKSFEIIVVDDGSSDGSVEIAQSYVGKDDRIALFTHTVNEGAYQARKTGVIETKGEYVLFLDGDDVLARHSLSRLDSLVSETPVDILHFAIKVVPAEGVDSLKARNHENWLLPFHGKYTGTEVIEACLLDELYCWNLCGKLLRGDLCRNAFAFCGEGSFSRAEDMVAYLMCAYFAQSYRGAPSEYLYCYNYGVGGDGTSVVLAEDFRKKWLCYPALIEEFKKFLVQSDSGKAVARVYIRKLSEILLRDTVDTFVGVLSREAYGEVLDETLATWDSLQVVPQLALRLWEDQARIACDAADAKLFLPQPIQPKRIALYCSTIESDEEVEALKSIANAWETQGCFVVLLVDGRVDERFVRQLNNVSVTMIQPRFGISSGVAKLRFQAIRFIVERDSIDSVVYCQWLSHALIWDICFLKSISVSVILHFSEHLSRPLKKLRSYYSTQPYVHALSDGCTFDDAPTIVKKWSNKAMRKQLFWSRVFAMTYRADDKPVPRALARKIIRLIRS